MITNSLRAFTNALLPVKHQWAHSKFASSLFWGQLLQLATWEGLATWSSTWASEIISDWLKVVGPSDSQPGHANIPCRWQSLSICDPPGGSQLCEIPCEVNVSALVSERPSLQEKRVRGGWQTKYMSIRDSKVFSFRKCWTLHSIYYIPTSQEWQFPRHIGSQISSCSCGFPRLCIRCPIIFQHYSHPAKKNTIIELQTIRWVNCFQIRSSFSYRNLCFCTLIPKLQGFSPGFPTHQVPPSSRTPSFLASTISSALSSNLEAARPDGTNVTLFQQVEIHFRENFWHKNPNGWFFPPFVPKCWNRKRCSWFPGSAAMHHHPGPTPSRDY